MTRRRKPAAYTEAADRFRALLKEVAADLKVEVGSELCKHVASLRLLRENAVAKACRGERVPVADIVALDAALKAYLPQSEGLQISIQYVEGVQGTYRCKHCGEQNHLEHGTYTPVESRRAEFVATPASEPATVAVPSTATATPAAAPAPVVDNIVPLIDYGVRRPPTSGDTYNPFGSEYHRG